MKHVGVVIEAITDVFREVFPEIAPEHFTNYSSYKMPRIGKMRSAWGIMTAQLPWHNPVNQALPEYFGEWVTRYESGEDMTRTYGVGANAGRMHDVALAA